MTFREFLEAPSTSQKLDDLIEANRVLDQELAAIHQRDQHEVAVLRYLRSEWQSEKTKAS